MPKVNIRLSDPERYASVREEQMLLRSRYATHIRMARLCPYCGHKIEVLCSGSHAGSELKCPNCSEDVFFPACSFRTA